MISTIATNHHCISFSPRTVRARMLLRSAAVACGRSWRCSGEWASTERRGRLTWPSHWMGGVVVVVAVGVVEMGWMGVRV